MKTAFDSNHNEVDNLDELLDYVKKKHDQGFWGEIWVKFRGGIPYLIREMRQIKLKAESDNLSLDS